MLDAGLEFAIYRKRLIYLTAAGLIVRIALWWLNGAAAPQIVDAQDYDGLAARIVERGGYVSAEGLSISLRPPLYPAFLALIYRVAGLHNYSAVNAVQSTINLATLWLVFRLGAAVYGRRVGLCAAVIFCFYPTFLAYEQLLLTEVLGTFLLTAATLSVVLARARRSWILVIAAGLLFGLASLTRSVTMLLVPFIAIWFVFAWPETFLKRCVAGGIVVAVFTAVIAPWSYRNTRLHHTLTFIDVMGGRNAMMGNYEHTPLERSWAAVEIAEQDKTWFVVLRRSRPQDYRPGITQGEIDKLAMRYALRFMRDNPGLTARRSLVKFFNFWQLEREVVAGVAQGFFGNAGRPLLVGLALLICGYYAACLFAAVFGTVLRPPSDVALHLLFLTSIAVPCAAHSIIFAHSRYHLPLVPLLTIYAASAFVSAPQILAQRRSLCFLAAATGCFVLTCGWVRELIMVDAHHLL